MSKRYIIKTDNSEGIPSSWELDEFRSKNGLSVNEVNKLYVTFKVNKRRKIKRLRINMKSHPCEYCGRHTYIDGKVGSKEFNKEVF